MSLNLVDIGVNLAHKSFRADLEQVIERAREAGVTRMVVTGTSEEGSEEALELAKRHGPGLWSTAGVHPHDAKRFGSGSLDALRALAEDPLVVAVGECGLDYERNFSPKNDQCECFEAQLDLASEVELPVFLHERRAHDELLEILKRFRPRLTRAVVHCFTGTEQELRAYLDLDLHIGITGWVCDERRGRHLWELLPLIPPERLMIETDAPFLMPRTLKRNDRRNEPAYLTAVLEAVAESVGKSPEVVAGESTRAAREFFALA